MNHKALIKRPLLISGLILLLLSLSSCENRDINEGENFLPREIHEERGFRSFDMVTVDGVDYLILEKDNNNPHEGFGFMAFRANNLVAKQDTLMAYMKTIHEMQVRMYAQITKIPLEQARNESGQLFDSFLDKAELERVSSATQITQKITISKLAREEQE